MTSSK